MLKKIASILEKKDFYKLIGIFFLMVISCVLDLVGISIILPIVTIILAKDNLDTSNIFIRLFVDVFKTTNVDTLFAISLIVIVCLFLIKSIYGIFYNYKISKFSLNYSRKLTKRLMDTYLDMPYEYHLDNNSSTLIRKSIYDVSNFFNAIGQILNLIVKGLTFLLIFIYLLTISLPITLITCAILTAFALITVILLKPRTRKIGKQIQKLNSDTYKYLSQTFLSIKETKICGKEQSFSDAYDQNRLNVNNLSLESSLLSSIPSNCIEFIGILGICISLFVLRNIFLIDSLVIVSTFSVFVYAVMKMLPIVIYYANTINNLNYYKASIDTLYEDLEKSKEFHSDKEECRPIDFKSTIECKNVSFAYSNSKDRVVLEDINLVIKKNTMVALFGPSGEGKTTLIDLILGLLRPTKGTIKADGINVSDNFKSWRNNISYIPQNIYLLDDTITRNVALGFKDDEIDINKVKEALKKAQLDEFIETLKDKENTIIGENGVRLSGGQKQRIGIARAFYRNTNIIVLDEATSALDYKTEENILKHISKQKEEHTIIIISHRESSLQIADSIYKVEDTHLIQTK